MKKWVEKLIEQFDFEWSGKSADGSSAQISEDRATLLFIIDTYHKHLMDVSGHPVRKVRETLDEFAKDLIQPPAKTTTERILFRFRQFFSTYRIDETAYVQKTFEEFRVIIWDFIDQLAEDVGQEQKEDNEINESLNHLKEAVESNSIEDLKIESRRFIDFYMEKQFKKDKRRLSKMRSVRKNLNLMKEQLIEAQTAARTDHLTGAFNRKTFDEYRAQYKKINRSDEQTVSMLLLDIDHFKKINDTYGHAIGDFVLKELVQTLKNHFSREADLVARVGGEEFAVLLPDFNAHQALLKAEELMAKVRSLVYVHEQHQIRFTICIGIAQLAPGESDDSWTKRADWALYNSKHSGRNRATVAPEQINQAA